MLNYYRLSFSSAIKIGLLMNQAK